jgi:uncharacterized protein YbaP (TraB family)
MIYFQKSTNIMRLRLLPLLTLAVLLSSQAFAQNANPSKHYQGLLWEISGKGTTRPSYLYGTMHVPEKLAFNLSDSFFVALRAVEMVSLETNHDVWQDFMEQMKEDGKNFTNSNGYGNEGRYDYTDLYGQSFLFEAPDTRLFEGMFAYRPVMANEFLYRSSGYSEDYEENTYLDLFIFQAGKKLGKQVIGLETMDGSYESVSRSRIPDDKGGEEEEYSRKYVSPDAIRNAYRKQDLDALDSLNVIMSPGKNFRKYMLDVRNIVMANGIDSIAQLGKTMFSAVGAAHLPGEGGVIETLRRKGYTVRPVKFSFDTAKKDMSQIDSMHYPVKFSKQTSKDSLWSADAPGKFYNTSDNWRVEQSLCADMSNGTYYAVYHIQTYGLWTGQSPEYISSRIDSIIYEKVPGKIQERKKLTAPFPGHEITTRTRRGDIQRYKIFITPYDIFMFMAGGNGSYVGGPEATQFFNSIRINESKLKPVHQSTVMQPAHGGFSVTFPVPPAINTADNETIENLYIAAYDDGPDSAFYFVTRVDYHDLDFIEEDTFEMNIICEKIAEQFTKNHPEYHLISSTPFPTQEFMFQSDKDKSHYFGRIVIDGPSYYLIGSRNVTGKKPEQFLNSFTILPNKWPEGFAEKTDTVGFFKVLLPKKEEKPLSPLFIALKKIGEEIQEKARAQYQGEYMEDQGSVNSSFESVTTGEKVYYSNNKFNTNNYPDFDSLQRSIKMMTTANNTMAIQSSNITKSGDTLIIFEYTAQDTNSNRGVISKTFVGGKRRYSLTALVNLDEPRSAFVTNIFNTFTPTDTSLHNRIRFGDRDLSFLKNIYAPDTLTRKKAISDLLSFGSFNFKPGDFQVVKAAIEQEGFHKLSFNNKRALLNAMGHTRSPETLNFLQSFYVQYADSVRYQELALNNIAAQHTKTAFTAMFDRWLQSTAYLGNGYFSILYDLSDTLELARHFVPQLMDLAKINAYKSTSLRVIKDIYEKGYTKPKSFKSLKPALRNEVQYAISMNRYNEESKNDKPEYGNYGSQGYYQDDPNTYTSDDWEVAMQLLMPFYEDDSKVKSLFDDMLKYGDENMKLGAIQLLLKAHKTVPKEIIQKLASKDKTRFELYKTLAETQQLDRYSNWFSDTLSLVKSYVVKNIAEDELDSVRFVSKHKSVINKQAATLFFFEYKRKKVKEWTLAYVTLPADLGIGKKGGYPKYPATYPSYEYGDPYGQGNQYAVQTIGSLDTAKEKKEFIDKKVGEIRFDGRRRYKQGRRNYYEE